ncbi:MAG TPA: 30S ribosomal protein S6 [Bacteroidota bacterium]|nr:30S ribosomal protein S6 [Bacteroidota bacterium]
MAQQQKIYEATFIVNAALDDPQIDAAIEKVKEFIVKNGGEIVELTKWGRKRFAFPIKKKNNGFYAVIVFKSAGDLVGKLERAFQLDENFLRYLVIYLDKKASAGRIPGSELLKLGTAAPIVTSGVPLATPVVNAEVPLDDDEVEKLEL